MMKKTIRFILLFVAVLAIAAVSLAAAVVQFSADLTMTLSGGQTMTGKVFIQGEKVRNEMTVAGQTSITIVRPDKKVTWILMPSAKKYQEQPMTFDATHPGADVQFTKKQIGTGKANGYNCKIIQYTFANKQYGIMIQWLATGINTAVRYQTKDKDGKLQMTIDYKNIKIGPQANSLFAIPAGYTKI